MYKSGKQPASPTDGTVRGEEDPFAHEQFWIVKHPLGGNHAPQPQEESELKLC